VPIYKVKGIHVVFLTSTYPLARTRKLAAISAALPLEVIRITHRSQL